MQRETTSLVRSLQDTIRINQTMMEDCAKLVKTVQSVTGDLTAAGSKLAECITEVKNVLDKKGNGTALGTYKSPQQARSASEKSTNDQQCGNSRMNSTSFHKPSTGATRGSMTVLASSTPRESLSQKSIEWIGFSETTTAISRSTKRPAASLKKSPLQRSWESRKWCLSAGSDAVTVSLNNSACTSDSEEEVTISRICQGKMPLQFVASKEVKSPTPRCNDFGTRLSTGYTPRTTSLTTGRRTFTASSRSSSDSSSLSVFEWDPEPTAKKPALEVRRSTNAARKRSRGGRNVSSQTRRTY